MRYAKLRRILGFSMLGLILYGSFLGLAAAFWTMVAPERFYHCWDDLPFVTFVLPFVHSWANASDDIGGVLRDYYIRPVSTVYVIWSCFVMVGIAVPSVLFWRIIRHESQTPQQSAA